MTSHDWTAHRLVTLFADGRGVVRSGPRVRDQAARAALLIDLSLRGRLHYGATTVELDQHPTGFDAADALLAALASGRHRALSSAVTSGPVGVIEVLGGSRRRPVWLSSDVVARERALVDAAAESGRAADPATAIVAVLAGALDLADDERRANLLVWCGAVRALVADCAVLLDAAMFKSMLIATPSGGGGG